MNRFGVVTIVLVAVSSFGCSDSKPESANTAISDTCDLQSARQDFLDGQKAANPGDYATAIKMYTQSAEGYETCAQAQREPDSLQSRYDEAMALWQESEALKNAHDPRSADVEQNAQTQFTLVAIGAKPDTPNRFYTVPVKRTLRQDATFNASLLKSLLESDALIQRASELATTAPNNTGGMSTFNNEDDAQTHCPDDTVVWLNLKSGVYHMKGERWYGATENGAYVCQQEADAAGDRATENGQ